MSFDKDYLFDIESDSLEFLRLQAYGNCFQKVRSRFTRLGLNNSERVLFKYVFRKLSESVVCQKFLIDQLDCGVDMFDCDLDKMSIDLLKSDFDIANHEKFLLSYVIAKLENSSKQFLNPVANQIYIDLFNKKRTFKDVQSYFEEEYER